MFSEVYPEAFKTSNMEHFAKTVNSYKPLLFSQMLHLICLTRFRIHLWFSYSRYCLFLQINFNQHYLCCFSIWTLLEPTASTSCKSLLFDMRKYFFSSKKNYSWLEIISILNHKELIFLKTISGQKNPLICATTNVTLYLSLWGIA